MYLNNNILLPVNYNALLAETKAAGFGMPSDIDTGHLLRTLIASKPNGNFLEMGTGTGLATLWMQDGLTNKNQLITVDNNLETSSIAGKYLNKTTTDLVVTDGYEWLRNYNGRKFDLIFADAMPGKYDLFNETIGLLQEGGFYVVDDMLPQPNWPEGHDKRVVDFMDMIDKRADLATTKLNWSTGIIVAVKNYLN